jgi:putative tryptophan/tyrosine transport system substrate-binding protein
VNRRESASILMALGASPLSGFAQQPGRTYRLGMMTSNARADWARNNPYLVSFVERLGELGFAEGRNLLIEQRETAGKADRLSALAAELARLNCDVLLASGPEDRVAALEQATRDTPIVVVAVDFDPLVTGRIASLARPGGRITGVTHLQSELPAKRVELLKDLLPSARRIAVLTDYSNTGQLASAQAGAKHLGVELHVLEFKLQPYDFEGAFREAVRAKAQALLALGSSDFVPARRKITELALRALGRGDQLLGLDRQQRQGDWANTFHLQLRVMHGVHSGGIKIAGIAYRAQPLGKLVGDGSHRGVMAGCFARSIAWAMTLPAWRWLNSAPVDPWHAYTHRHRCPQRKAHGPNQFPRSARPALGRVVQ